MFLLLSAPTVRWLQAAFLGDPIVLTGGVPLDSAVASLLLRVARRCPAVAAARMPPPQHRPRLRAAAPLRPQRPPHGPQPIDEQWMESDTVRPCFAARYGHPQGQITDLNPYYGRVAYTYAAGVDQPLGVVRMGYTSRLDALNRAIGTRDFEPTTIVPLWSSRGQASIGAFADGTWRRCFSDAHCMNLAWPDLWAGYGGIQGQRSFWHGSLLEDKSDASGLKFRRNRYYDPGTGRFTQEDPIGLAGGMNLYGFAAGDPVNFVDPSGLKVCFKGTASEVNRLRAATEQATGSAIWLDRDSCIRRVGYSMNRELRPLRERLNVLHRAQAVYSVGFRMSEDATYRNRTRGCSNYGQSYFCPVAADLGAVIYETDIGRAFPADYLDVASWG